MSFTGKYELETQENYEEFLEAIGIHISFFTRQKKGWVWFIPFCNRTPRCQDWPQSDNRGGPEWEYLHLDAKHPQLELVKHVHRRPGMWAGDHEGHQIQGGWMRRLTSEGGFSVRALTDVFTTRRLQSWWMREGSQCSFLSTTSQQRSLGTSW